MFATWKDGNSLGNPFSRTPETEALIAWLKKIDKPALLRQLFEVGTGYSTQIMSFNKMLGQLQDAGNTTTLARYLNLLSQAGLLSGLNKYNSRPIETKGTMPKFQVHNTALLSAQSVISFKVAISDPAGWGKVVENSVGAYLVGQTNQYPNAALFYWRENNIEIDYVLIYGKKIIGIEVKSGDESISEKTTEKFIRQFPNAKLILVGKYGIPYETFVKTELCDLVMSL
jgi:predicted AAA+ superfamily ATPase